MQSIELEHAGHTFTIEVSNLLKAVHERLNGAPESFTELATAFHKVYVAGMDPKLIGEAQVGFLTDIIVATCETLGIEVTTDDR
jgi:hypothetical protein